MIGIMDLVDKVRDRNEPKCSVCSVPLYLHNEPCEVEFSDDAETSRRRDEGIRR